MQRRHHRRVQAMSLGLALGVGVATGAVASSDAQAQAIQLSQSTGTGVNPLAITFTPQGRVVYLNNVGLCSAPLDQANAQLRLSAIRPDGFRLTPDGTRVFFVAGTGGTPGPTDLYGASTALADSQVQLSTPVVSGTHIDAFDFTPDGSRVAYSQNLSTGSESWQFKGVYSAPGNAPGPHTRIDSLPLDAQYRAVVKIAPGGQTAAYVAGDDFLPVPDRNNLYTASMNVGGTQQKKSNDTSTLGIDTFDFWFSPDSNNVVYRTSSMPGTVWSAPSAGAGAAVALKTNATTPTALPDHTKLYLASPASNSARGADVYLATPGNVPAPIKLNGPHVSGGEAVGLTLTPVRQGLVFQADYNTDGADEVFSVAFASPGQHVRLSDPALAGRLVGSTRVASTPDGDRVFYTADTNANGIHDLYSARVGMTGTQVMLSSATNAAHRADLSSSFASPDGSIIFYKGDMDIDNRFEWYAASTNAGGTQRRLFPSFNDHVLSLGITGDGQYLYYTLDENNSLSSAEGLYAVPIDGGPSMLLGRALIDGGTVSPTLRLAPDGQTVLFLADVGAVGRKELFAVTVPEPAALAVAAMTIPALALRRRR